MERKSTYTFSVYNNRTNGNLYSKLRREYIGSLRDSQTYRGTETYANRCRTYY